MSEIIFPTNKKPIVLPVEGKRVALHIVQCFRHGKGYELLAHIHGAWATWCLVCKSEVADVVRATGLNFNGVLTGGLR